MSNHIEIAAATELDIYFCDPHSPWQLGSNENTNGPLRQYFPKGTDLSGYHPDCLDFVAAQLNSRPQETIELENTRRSTRPTTLRPRQSTRCCVDRLNPPSNIMLVSVCCCSVYSTTRFNDSQ